MHHVARLTILTLLIPSTAWGQETSQEARVAKALSAAPATLAAAATVREWASRSVLRQGTNGYTCFPGLPGGTHPMCLDTAWIRFIEARLRGEPPPQVTGVAIGYWLQGAEPMSNDSPGATTNMFDGSPHIALLMRKSLMTGLPDTLSGGAPWIMWKNTPYAHVMVLVPKGL